MGVQIPCGNRSNAP